MARDRDPKEIVDFSKLICPFSMMAPEMRYCRMGECLAWKRKEFGLCTFFSGFNGMGLHIRYIAEAQLHMAKVATAPGKRLPRRGDRDEGDEEGF